MKQTAIVTGGSRGIGFAIARQLGQDFPILQKHHTFLPPLGQAF